MTEGSLPWRLVRLGEVARLIRGVTFSGEEAQNTSRPEYVPVLRAGNIAELLNTQSDLLWIPEKRVSAEQRLRLGDIAICMSSGSADVVGKTALLEDEWDGCVGAFCAIIRPRSHVLPHFLAAYLRSAKFTQWRRSQAQGANIQNLRAQELERFPIPLPSLSEQQRIVTILQEAEALRRLCIEAETRTGELSSAVFAEIFGTPSAWKRGPHLGSLVRIVGGGTPSKSIAHFYTGKIPWATAKDIKKLYLDDTESHITEEAVRSSATNVVPKGTVLVVVKSKILAHSLPVAITEVPMCFGQDLKGLVPNEGISPEFLVYGLQAQVGRILSRARGANTEGLTLDALRSLMMPEPRVEAVARLTVACKEIRQLSAATAAHRHLQMKMLQSLSAHAFTRELTSAWRRMNQSELLREVHSRDVALYEDGAAPLRFVEAAPRDAPDAVDHRSVGIYSGLNREQRLLLREIERMTAESGPYFTAEQLAGYLEGPLHRRSHTIEAHLSVLAVRGIIVAVSRPRKSVEGRPFAACYRLARGGAEATVDPAEPRLGADDVRWSCLQRHRKLFTDRQ